MNCTVLPTCTVALAGDTTTDCNVAPLPSPSENTTVSGSIAAAGLQLEHVVWNPFTVVVGFVFA